MTAIMRSKRQDWAEFRGDTFGFGFQFIREFTLDEVHFSCKKNKKDTAYMWHKTLSDGVYAGEDNKYIVKATPSDMDLEEGVYYYDVQIDTGSDVRTIIHGLLTVMEDTTK